MDLATPTRPNPREATAPGILAGALVSPSVDLRLAGTAALAATLIIAALWVTPLLVAALLVVATVSATALATAAALIVQTRGDGADVGHFDVSLTTAEGRDFRSRQKIHTVTLFQRTDDHLELRIGQDASEAEHLRNLAAVGRGITQT